LIKIKKIMEWHKYPGLSLIISKHLFASAERLDSNRNSLIEKNNHRVVEQDKHGQV